MAQLRVRHLTSASEIESLRPLWLALHEHHRGLPSSPPLQSDDEVSWRGRSATYRRWLDEDAAIVLAAVTDDGVAGYLVAHLEPGVDDDTFDFGDRYAELYTLSILPGQRGRGVGGRLLDALDEALRAASIRTLTVAAMAGNEGALAFYRRLGFQPLEATFYRQVPQRGDQAGIRSRTE